MSLLDDRYLDFFENEEVTPFVRELKLSFQLVNGRTWTGYIRAAFSSADHNGISNLSFWRFVDNEEIGDDGQPLSFLEQKELEARVDAEIEDYL